MCRNQMMVKHPATGTGHAVCVCIVSVSILISGVSKSSEATLAEVERQNTSSFSSFKQSSCERLPYFALEVDCFACVSSASSPSPLEAKVIPQADVQTTFPSEASKAKRTEPKTRWTKPTAEDARSRASSRQPSNRKPLATTLSLSVTLSFLDAVFCDVCQTFHNYAVAVHNFAFSKLFKTFQNKILL